MKVVISSILRKLAGMIVEDNTPTDEDILRLRKQTRRRYEQGDPQGEAQQTDAPSPEVPTTGVVEEKVEYLAPPKQRRPRREPEHHKKWNEEDKTGLMKDYMKDYRSESKDVGNRYVKKPKI